MSRIKNIIFVIPVPAALYVVANLETNLTCWEFWRSAVVVEGALASRIETAMATSLWRRVGTPSTMIS
jgi:hypothetical protein